MMLKLLFSTILFLFFSACTSKYDSLNEAQKHTLKSSNLKLLMHDMNMVIYEKSKSVLDHDNARRRYAFTLADNIKKISSQMKQPPADKFTSDMNKKDIAIFNNYIKKLYQKGEDIYQLAQNYELEKLDSKLQEMEQICKACHSDFRDK